MSTAKPAIMHSATMIAGIMARILPRLCADCGRAVGCRFLLGFIAAPRFDGVYRRHKLNFVG
jgi:hypothetical protein